MTPETPLTPPERVRDFFERSLDSKNLDPKATITQLCKRDNFVISMLLGQSGLIYGSELPAEARDWTFEQLLAYQTHQSEINRAA